MPFGGGKTSTVNVSGLIWDIDLIVPAANRITVDHVDQTTIGHGVEIDNIGDTTSAVIMVLGGGPSG
jgi:hypothetical protein